jgi:hypothetical protein|tara:strand:- start:11905 stop:12390 length:486 start_codon:yes stop_codon:yes gene_type:complete
MEFKELQKELNRFGKYVVQQSRSNLTKQKKNVNKTLYNSIGYKIEETANSFVLSFEMEDYGKFQDQGVSGIKVKYNTPFKYTNKMPPAKAFDKWGIKRGIAPRGKGGQFEKRKGLDFALARSIYYKGIKPSMFFTKPFDKAFERLPEEIANSLIKDITENI